MQGNLIIYAVVTTLLTIVGIYRCRTEGMSFWNESGYPLLIATWTGVWFLELLVGTAWK